MEAAPVRRRRGDTGLGVAMGWFLLAPPTPDGVPTRHVVTVRRTDDDRVAGAGVVVGADTLLTCAHVVNDALGLPLFDSRDPGRVAVPVELRGKTGFRQDYAILEHWIPPRSANGGRVVNGDATWLGDLALLRLETPSGELPAPPRRTAMSQDQRVQAWHGSGNDATFADLTVTLLAGSVGYVDGAPTGMAVGPGYSGSPLWSPQLNAVVGLVAGAFLPDPDPGSGAVAPYNPQNMARRSWAIPWQRIETELRPLGVLDTLSPETIDPDDPVFAAVADLVADLLPSGNPRVECGLRLARACGVRHGSDVTPPTPEEFASFLLAHPRAPAALSAILRRQPGDGADRVLAAAGAIPAAKLLTAQEYVELRKRLRDMDPGLLGRLPETVRAALPHLATFPDGSDLDMLLDQLESLPGDGGSGAGERRVPALLRVMEYLAVLCPEPSQAELRLWTRGVASRLGVALAALDERRWDAQAWARTVRERSARVRVLVEVKQAESDRHRLGIWCDEGSGPQRMSTGSGGSYSPSEAAREVLRVIDSLPPATGDFQPPLIEVFVDRDSLDLPVDEWEAQVPGELVRGVLGVEFPVVVHCPELLRRHKRFEPHWHTRWSRLDSGGPLRVDESTDPVRLYARLVNQLDTVRVSVDVPPGRQRDGIVQTCLALGIPVVVWDRGSEGRSHAVKHMTDVATRHLPDGVLGYRAYALADPSAFPGQPVLAWADADRTIPRLQLTEPQESS
ncbi:VMAP-C domain-containing protein [Streptomyces panaciradicis]|uniref:VMAP-C domain-containing protein n=1 Tax=Streptomyces panaciradicis TaxID=1470261 RepID=UPI00201D172C|nr:trypsin-like peptidase domain-containing protein [Streptomyces panaciradicis]MCL6673936.1 serine protease [Streptomyces panaciradicis]